MKNTQTNRIKQDLINGVQFGNDVANWYSLVSVDKNFFMLDIRGELKFYKNIDSVAKRINRLMNTWA
jgi:hypothetical protein